MATNFAKDACRDPGDLVSPLSGSFGEAASVTIRAGDIAQRELLECAPDTPLSEVARRMAEARVSSMLVVDRGVALGIWTERDALAIDFSQPGHLSRPVADFMSSPVRSVPADVGLQELALRFRDEHVRHYLVVDAAGARIGIVSQTDVVLNQGIEHYLRLRRVDSVIKPGLTTLPPDLPLSEATRLMRERGVDAVVVEYGTDEHGAGEFGIVTERDLVRLIACLAGAGSVGEAASRPLVTVDEEASLYHVRCMLLERHLRHVGVVRKDGRLADLIGFSDILSGMELMYVKELRQALRERDRALSASRENLRLAEKIIETSFEGVIVTDADRCIQSVNPAFTRLTGYTQQDVIGKNPSILSSGRHGPEFYAAMWSAIARDGRWQGEVWNRRKNGELFPELLTITAIADTTGEITHYVAVFSDISQLKQDEARIRHLAYFDPLTNLPNRRLLEDRIHVAIAHAHRSGEPLALMFIDLDGFKHVNDTLGHDVGDELLVEIARRFSECVREDDTVARLGGDEFVVLLGGIEAGDPLDAVAARLIARAGAPVQLGSRTLAVTASIGIAEYPAHAQDSAQLLKCADTAMYRAKMSGRNRCAFYRPDDA